MVRRAVRSGLRGPRVLFPDERRDCIFDAMPAKNKRARAQSARRAREHLWACNPYMRDFITANERFDFEGAVTVDELTSLTISELTCTELSDLVCELMTHAGTSWQHCGACVCGRSLCSREGLSVRGEQLRLRSRGRPR